MLLPGIFCRCKKTTIKDCDDELSSSSSSSPTPTSGGSIGTLGARGFESSLYSGNGSGGSIWPHFADPSLNDRESSSSSMSNGNTATRIAPEDGSDGRVSDEEAGMLLKIYESCTVELPLPANCAAGNNSSAFIPDLSIISEESSRAGMSTVGVDSISVVSTGGAGRLLHKRAEKEAHRRILLLRESFTANEY
eukprot:CAMPEP_0196823822 /NCGR_PEP_ID=MMETSP1362-20130617/89203_1 /TAXON_ID=163516 /ORGANISM="Leptocylindrus danicus, Strain CCMP1856" /LENGTH=192 /DNA_ID=CAMNT_0042203835 /DNA_START=148 /DNA_END=726 /DNA_ORIENTATION=+